MNYNITYNDITFSVDKLPKSCLEKDCPFNYDTISCKLLPFDCSCKEYKEVCDYISDIGKYKGKRYPNCPLKLKRNNKKQ